MNTRKEKDRKRYEEHIEERRAYQRRYYQEHKEHYRKYHRIRAIEEQNKRHAIKSREKEIAIESQNKYEELYKAVVDMRHQQKRYKRFDREDIRERMEVAEQVVDNIINRIADTQQKIF